MRLFDEECREIFLYDYSQGEWDSHWSVTLYSYRDIPQSEIDAAIVAHGALQGEYDRAVEEAREKCGINHMRQVSRTKDRLSSEEERAAMDKFGVELAKLQRPKDWYDFMLERLGLKVLEVDRSL